MSAVELRASISLASIFALRMFGLFLILPVLGVHAAGLPGGQDARLVGLALGIYGLTQALLHLPYGLASDRLGRKPVIVAGLLLFAFGSFVAAASDSLWWTIIGRALQGAGAISAAVTAFIADATRDSQRTKAMAMVGGSIGVTFALSLVLAPLLYGAIGMGGIFALTGVLALVGIAVVVWITPEAPVSTSGPVGQQDAGQDGISARVQDKAPGKAQDKAPGKACDKAQDSEQGATQRSRLRDVAVEPDLLRLNFGIFVLHAVQMAMFVVVPAWLVQSADLPVTRHWVVYLPVVLVSFLLMLPAIIWGERYGRMRIVFTGGITLLLLVLGAFAFRPSGLAALAGLLLGFFTAFNVLEATLPSLVSRLAPADAKGAALGIYNTTQSLGLFTGGLIGGVVLERWHGSAVFVVCGVLVAIWLVVAIGHRRWPATGRAQPA